MKKFFILFLILAFGINTNLSFSQVTGEIYKKRRQELSKTLSDGIAVMPSEVKQYGRTKDNKNFYYLTGLQVPSSTLIITPDLNDKDLLVTESSRLDKEVSENFEIVKYEEASKILFKLSRKYKKVAIPYSTVNIENKLNIYFDAFDEIIKLDAVVHDMRIIKDDQEIENLKEAINITADALNEVYKYTEPGLTEKNLRSVIRYKFESNDTEEAFLQAASGPNSTNIHFGATGRVLKENDLIVFDVGTYYKRYTSDISRTIPVSGKFTTAQTEIYNIVLKAQKKGIELTVKGNNHTEVHKAITEVLVDGLYDLKLITDKDSEWQKKLYMVHGWGHFIGLDVHDVIAHFRMKEDKTYDEGMILTVEPGLYFPENYLDKIPRQLKDMVSKKEFENYKKGVLSIYKKYENNGVRIEDDVLITKDGNVILSSGVPKEINEIEKLMEQRSFFNVGN